MARLDKPVTTIAMSTSRIEKTVLLLDQHHRSGLSRIEEIVANLQAGGCDVRNARTLAVVDPRALTISPQEIEALYLHQQVETITDSFRRIASTMASTQEYHNKPYIFPLAPTIIAYDSPSAHHRHTVSAALEILRILDDKRMPSHLSVQRSAWNMVNFAIHLHGLEMYPDAVVMGTWTVDLYRTLVAINAAVFEPYLALALHNLSRYYVDVDDNDKAKLALEESIRIQRGLLPNLSQNNIRLQLSSSLMALWSILSGGKGVENGLKAAHESLAILEALGADLNNHVPLLVTRPSHVSRPSATTQPSLRIASTMNPMSQATIAPHLDDFAMWLDFNTARARHGISCTLYNQGQYSKALEMGQRALDILSDLSYRYPGIFDAALAGCLVHLSRPYVGVDRSTEDTLHISEQAVRLYRQLCRTRPKKFTKFLVETLWEYAILLIEVEKYEVAESIAAEAVDTVRRSEKDRMLLADALHHASWILRRMNLYESAVSLRREVVAIYREVMKESNAKLPPESLADRMCDLANELHLANRIDDAVAVCQEAVDLYRSIVGSNSSRSQMAGLAMSLSHLTHTMNMIKKHDLAMQAGSEALELYRGLVHDDSYFVHHFLVTLRRTSFASCYSDDPQALIRNAQIISDYRTLEVHHARPDVRWGLANALKDRDFILGKHRQHHEALLNSEQLVRTIRSIPVDGVEAAVTLMEGLSVHAENLAHAGRMGEAIIFCEEGISHARHIAYSADLHHDFDLALADILYEYSQCLRAVGRTTEAFTASEEIVVIHRRHPSAEDGVCRLREHSINLRLAKRYMEAVEFGKEAVKNCRRMDSATVLADVLLPYALESLSTCLADSGDEDQALTVIKEAVEFYRKTKSNGYLTSTWAYVEVLYADALVNLASRSMAKETWDTAEAALLEAKDIYQSRAIVAPGYYPDLAITLDLTAVFLCAVGRGNDTTLAMQDLAERQLRLKALYPEIAMLAQMALDDLRTTPSQRKLRQKILQLTQ